MSELRMNQWLEVAIPSTARSPWAHLPEWPRYRRLAWCCIDHDPLDDVKHVDLPKHCWFPWCSKKIQKIYPQILQHHLFRSFPTTGLVPRHCEEFFAPQVPARHRPAALALTGRGRVAFVGRHGQPWAMAQQPRLIKTGWLRRKITEPPPAPPYSREKKIKGLENPVDFPGHHHNVHELSISFSAFEVAQCRPSNKNRSLDIIIRKKSSCAKNQPSLDNNHHNHHNNHHKIH